MKNKYIKMFYDSITKDVIKWSIDINKHEETIWKSCIYRNENQDEVYFKIDGLPTVVLNNKEVYMFPYIPFFSDMSVAVRKMKKVAKNKKHIKNLKKIKLAMYGKIICEHCANEKVKQGHACTKCGQVVT